MSRKVKPRIVVAFLVPGFTMFLYFVMIPMLRSFYISLTDWNGFSAKKTFIGIENFKNLFSDITMQIAFRNTMFYLVYGGIIVFALCLWFAYLLTKKGFRPQKVFSNFFYFPNMISAAALAVLWVFFFNTNFGLLNAIMEKIGLASFIKPWFGDRRTAMTCITLVSTISQVGFYLILVLSGVNRIPLTFLEAASIDGASPIRSYFLITLPLLKEVLVISVSLWIINAVKYFELIWAMFKGSTQYTQTLATYMYTVSFGVQVPIFKLGYGSAVAIVMFLLVAISVGIVRLVFDRDSLQY